MDLLDNITLKDLDAEQRQLAKCIGMDAYKHLLEHYAGSYVYVRKPDTVTTRARNARIREEFNGCNYQELAQKFGLSEISIRRIIAAKSRR
ncbi:MAG: DNA-binding protein [Oscillospiraceae bacterium]|nr:DNA-binding protein [Oscillospiraceae bacterium]